MLVFDIRNIKDLFRKTNEICPCAKFQRKFVLKKLCIGKQTKIDPESYLVENPYQKKFV